jgi:hypothetical protein
LPVLRLQRFDQTPEKLEARAITLACAIRDGERVEPTPQLRKWAENALAGKYTIDHPFEDPDLEVRSNENAKDSVFVRDLGLQWEPPEDVDSIGPGLDEQTVETKLYEARDRLTDLGILNDDSFQPSGLQFTNSSADWPDDIEVSYGIWFSFALRPGFLRGAHLEIRVMRDGELGQLVLSDLDIARVGDQPAALSGEEAEAEFTALVEQAKPSPELETRIETLVPGYALPPGVDAADTELRMYGTYYYDDPNSETPGERNRASLSMVWPEEGLRLED